MTTVYPDTTDERLVMRLKELADAVPGAARMVRLYGAILPLLRGVTVGSLPPALTKDQALAKLAQGRFLLQDLDLEFDVPAIAGLLVKLAAAAEHAGENVKADRLAEWADEHEADLGAVMQNVLEGSGRLMANAAQRMGMDAAVCRVLAQNALTPSLRAWSSGLTAVADGASWNAGACFVCGAPPLLGELQGNAQALHLRCGLCGADWQYRRLACTFCGSEDHREREYLYREDDHDKAHVEACTRCATYLKVIPAFAPTPAELLLLEDLATLHLDSIAAERGYRRASVR